MRGGRRTREPVGRVSGIGRVDGPSVVLRVRGLEQVSSASRVVGPAPERSFAQVLDRHQRGIGHAEPLAEPSRSRAPLPPPPDDGEPHLPPDPPQHDSFLERLRFKLQEREKVR